MRPTVPEVLPLVLEYVSKPSNSEGGSLHIVLADYNVEDRSIQYCSAQAHMTGDEDGEYLAELLLAMSRTQRLKVAHSWRLG